MFYTPGQGEVCEMEWKLTVIDHYGNVWPQSYFRTDHGFYRRYLPISHGIEVTQSCDSI